MLREGELYAERDRERKRKREGRNGMQTGGKIAMGDAKLLAWMLRWENARTIKSHCTRERERETPSQ